MLNYKVIDNRKKKFIEDGFNKTNEMLRQELQEPIVYIIV